MNTILPFMLILILAVSASADKGLAGYWKLQNDCIDYSGNGNNGVNNGVRFNGESAEFNGAGAFIKIRNNRTLQPGTNDFSISAWVKCEPGAQVTGDIVNKYDPAARRGINLHVNASSPGYSSASDCRNLQFGIDNAVDGKWVDCGRPWSSNPLISTLTVYKGHLYTGTSDASDPNDACHVYRYDGGSKWVDCGRVSDDPKVPSIFSITVHKGGLYVGTGVWDWERAWNKDAGPVHVYRYMGGKKWHDCGRIGKGYRVKSMASFGGNLYVSDDEGFVYRYDGDGNWPVCGDFKGGIIQAMMVYQGHLYGTIFGSGFVYRYDGGTEWTLVGEKFWDKFGANQLHTLEVYSGSLYLGTWPDGRVLRYDGDTTWTDCGWMGVDETFTADGTVIRPDEVNDLTVYNGKLYAGVIPKAQVWRYDDGTKWTCVKQLVDNPDYSVNFLPSWMRVPSMTIFNGRLYCGTGTCQARTSNANLDTDAGKVFAWEAGKNVSYDDDLGTKWRHIVAVRKNDRIRLYIDGKLVSTSEKFDPSAYDLSNDRPFLIGFGAANYFHGSIRDVRLYNRGLSGLEARALFEQTK